MKTGRGWIIQAPAKECLEPPEAGGVKDAPLEPPNPGNALISDFWPWTSKRTCFCFLKTRFVTGFVSGNMQHLLGSCATLLSSNPSLWGCLSGETE